jgi:hypothetical protein
VRVLFTGQSGTRVGKVVESIAAQLPKPTPIVVKFEEFFVEAHLKRIETLGWAQAERDAEKAKLCWKGGIQVLLRRPKSYLHEIWRDAFELMMAATTKDAHILFAMHAVYYQTQTREFFIPTSGELVRKLELDSIITLIDDIYDIYDRLRGTAEIFTDKAIHKLPEDARAFERLNFLNRVLDWRAKEIIASEKLSLQAGISHSVLAVKHPLRTAIGLLNDEVKQVYVSHPITEVRRLHRSGRTAEADSIAGEINDLTSTLAVAKEVTPIFPTSIDELRIGIAHPDEPSETYEARLEPRWPLVARDGDLLLPPSSVGNPLDIDGYFAKCGREDLRAAHVILKHVLADAMLAQIDSRDHKLVDQVAALLIYRPYFNGNASRGVREEIIHRTERFKIRADPEPKPCIVYCPVGDLVMLRINGLRKSLRSDGAIGDGDANRLVAGLMTTVAVREKLGTRSGAPWSAVELEAVVTGLGINVEFGGSADGGALGADRAVVVNEQMRDMWGKWAAELSVHPLESHLLPDDLWWDEEMTPSRFATRAIEVLTAKGGK